MYVIWRHFNLTSLVLCGFYLEVEDIYAYYCLNSQMPTLHIIFCGCSAKATDEYESARRKVAAFMNASDSREIVFTRNATEAINLVAYSWGLSNLKPEDEVFHSG